MKTFSELLALCGSPVDSHHKGPVMHSFGVFFAVSLNKLLNKRSSETMKLMWPQSNVISNLKVQQTRLAISTQWAQSVPVRN